MDQEKYPVFSGRVVNIPAIVEGEGDTITLVDYVTIRDEPTISVGELFMTLVIPEEKGKLEKDLSSRVQRAVIPMRLDPSLILGAEIRTRYGEVNAGDYGSEKIARTYELEIINPASRPGADVFSTLSDMAMGRPHTGFKYVKILDEDS